MSQIRNYLGALIMGLLIPSALAQDPEALVQKWKVQADDPANTYILSTGDATRGMYLNKSAATGGSLLVASRANGTSVRRIDPATGQLKTPATIPNTYIASGATFPINKVVVSADGVIYVMSVALASTTSEQNFRIYRHASELVPETLAFSLRTDNFGATPGINVRLGDDADIIGTGNDTKILVAGSGGHISLFTTTDGGLTFTRTAITTNPPVSGTPHIAWDPTTPNRFFYRGSAGELARAYDISGATATGATGAGNDLPSATAAQAYGPFDIGLVGTEKSVVLGIGASTAGTPGKPILVARMSDLQVTYHGVGSEFAPGGAKTNGNGAGDVYLDSDTNEIYVLYTNNSVTKWAVPPSAVADWALYQSN